MAIGLESRESRDGELQSLTLGSGAESGEQREKIARASEVNQAWHGVREREREQRA